MRVSLGEIETTAAKAAEGAGIARGCDTDIGFALRWLVARGLPAESQLADALARLDGPLALPPLAERSAEGWRWNGHGASAMFVTGTAVDLLVAGPGSALHLAGFRDPIFILPLVDRRAEHGEGYITVRWRAQGAGEECAFVLGDGRASYGPAADRLLWPEGPVDIVMTMLDGAPEAPLEGPGVRHLRMGRAAAEYGIDVDPASWTLIKRFAERILVPDSEHSRLAGAGAGDIDND